MTRKTDGKDTTKSQGQPDLDELLASDSDGVGFDFDGIQWDTFGRLATATARLGGLVSLYLRTDDGTLNVSVRIGEKRKSYGLADGEQFSQLCRGIAEKLELALHKGKKQGL